MSIGAAAVPLGKELRIRAAALHAFCDPLPADCQQLFQLSAREWRRLLRWLDTSGLALYLFARLEELHLCERLPKEVLARLQQNCADNAERTRSLISELISIQRDFQEASISYVSMKGFSLWPSSVPRLELRSQLDLDFLVAEHNLLASRSALERRGYRLQAVSGRTWEFKKSHPQALTLSDLYKAVPYRTVELHIEAASTNGASLLARSEHRDVQGVMMPVLSPIDQLIGQGLHLYKHLFRDFMRTAHLVEFRRHVIYRSVDNTFWDQLRSRAEGDLEMSRALGLVALLADETIGAFAPKSLTEWAVKSLPPSAQLWVNIYGARTVLARFPGAKLHLLLRKELVNSADRIRPLQRALLPFKLPPSVILASPKETWTESLRRHRMQAYFVLFRLRFHLVEGLRYLWESFRWRRIKSAHAR